MRRRSRAVRNRYMLRVGQLAALGLIVFSVGNACPGVVNQPPTAQDQTVTVAFGAATVITLGATDPDAGPQALAFSIVTQPTNGSLSAVSGNAVTYTPNSGYSGPDSFTFTASDGSAGSNVATVSITVQAPASPPATIASDTTLDHLLIGAGATTTLQNNAVLTVTGDVIINGTLSAVDGRLFLRVVGRLTINGTLSALHSLSPDLPSDAPYNQQPVGIHVIVGSGAVTFGENAVVQTNGHYILTDDEGLLGRTPADLFDEVENVGGDNLPTFVPLPPENSIFSQPAMASPQMRVRPAQAGLPPVVVAGTWPPLGAPAPAGDKPTLILRFLGTRDLILQGWTFNGPPAPARPGGNAQGQNGKNGLNLNIWNNGGPIVIQGVVTLNLSAGAPGDNATAVCASATGGNPSYPVRAILKKSSARNRPGRGRQAGGAGPNAM